MKKYFLALLFASVLLPSVCFADSVPDQVCVGNPLTDGVPNSYRSSLNGQVFVPTLNHISKVAIFGKSAGAQTAKVKLKIQKAWYSFNGNPTFEKIIVLNDSSWWVEADFHEVTVEPALLIS